MSVARIALAVVGAVIGALIPGAGWLGVSIGFSVGGIFGALLFPPKGPVGPRLNDLRVSSSTNGAPIAFGYGRQSIAGNVIWSPGLVSHEHQTSTGGLSGGQTATSFTYTASFAVAFCEGPACIRRVWGDSKLIWLSQDAIFDYPAWDSSVQYLTGDLVERADSGNPLGAVWIALRDNLNNDPAAYSGAWRQVYNGVGTGEYTPMTQYPGDEAQLPDPAIQGDKGVANTPAFRGLCYGVWVDFPLADFGNRIPNIRAEIASHAAGVDSPQPNSGTNGSRVFDDINQYAAQYLSTPPSNVYNGLTKITLSAWIKPADAANSAIFSKGSSDILSGTLPNAGPAYIFVYGGPNINGSVMPEGSGGSEGISVSVERLCPNVWTHVAMTYDDDDSVRAPRLFICGVEVTYLVRNPQTRAFSDWQGTGWYFNHDFAQANHFTGKMEEFKIWNIALTPAEVAASMFDPTVQAAHLVGHWGIDGVSSPEPDSSGNGNDASLLSATGGPPPAGSIESHGTTCGPIQPNCAIPIRTGCTLDPIPLSTIVSDICKRSGLTPDQIDVSLLATDLDCLGYTIGRPTPAVQALLPLAQAFFFDGVESDGKIKFVPRGQDPVLTIPEADLGLAKDHGAIVEQIGQQQELPRDIVVLHLDQQLDYQQNKQQKLRSSRVVKTRNEEIMELAIVMTPDTARRIAEKALFLRYLERKPFNFNLWKAVYMQLDPTDVIEFDYENLTFEARLVKMDLGQGFSSALSGVDENASNYLSTVIGGSGSGFTRPSPPVIPPTIVIDNPPPSTGGGGGTGGTGGGATAYSSRTDLVAAPETIPALCSPAPCIMASSDLNPDLPYTRVTDGNTDTAHPSQNSSWQISNSIDNLWSIDDSTFMLFGFLAETTVFKFDPTTQLASVAPCSFGGLGCAGGMLTIGQLFTTPDISYSWVTPNVIYGINGTLLRSADIRPSLSNPATAPTVATLADMAACPGIPTTGLSNTHIVTVSSDDSRYHTSAGGSQDNEYILYVFDKNLGCRWLRTDTMQLGGEWGPTGAVVMHDASGNVISTQTFSDLHGSQMSVDGRWVIFGRPAGSDNWWWDLATNNLYHQPQAPAEGSCYQGGHEAIGYNDVVLHQDGSSSFYVRQTAPFFNACAPLVSTIPAGFAFSSDVHDSWKNLAFGQSQPVIIGANVTFAPTVAWQDELLAMSTDGTDTVWRFGHAYSRSTQYGAQILPSVSHDGKWLIFGSDWGGSSRVDVFLIPLR